MQKTHLVIIVHLKMKNPKRKLLKKFYQKMNVKSPRKNPLKKFPKMIHHLIQIHHPVMIVHQKVKMTSPRKNPLKKFPKKIHQKVKMTNPRRNPLKKFPTKIINRNSIKKSDKQIKYYFQLQHLVPSQYGDILMALANHQR